MPDNVSLLGSVSFAWLHEHGGSRYDEPFFLDPRRRLEQEAAANAVVAERFPEDPIYNFEACLVQVEGRRRPVVLVGGLQPNLILGAAVGARFVFYGDKDPDITPAPLADIRDVAALRGIDWEHTWPIDLFLRQVRQAREELGGEYAVIPPFFWDATGRATTHGIVTTAQKLLGERIFLDLADNPSFARELFDWIADAYARLIRLFADAAGLAITGLHTGDCSACMLGPDPYAELVLPSLNRLIDALPMCTSDGQATDRGTTGSAADTAQRGVRLHSCGLSDHLLEVFAGVHGLTCLNVGSNTGIGAIRRRFGGIRIDVIPDARLLTAAAPDDVEAWVRRTLEENGNGRIEFQFHLDAGQPEENCRRIARTLRDLGVECPRERVF